MAMQQENRPTVTSHQLLSLDFSDIASTDLLTTITVNVRQRTENYNTEEDVVVKSTLNNFAIRYLNAKHPNARKAGYHVITRNESGTNVFTHVDDAAPFSSSELLFGLRSYFCALGLAILMDSKSISNDDVSNLQLFTQAFGLSLASRVQYAPTRVGRPVIVKSNIWSAFLPALLNSEIADAGLDVDFDYIKQCLVSLILRRGELNEVKHFDAYITALYSDVKDSPSYKLNFRITTYRVFINTVHERLWPQIQDKNMVTTEDGFNFYPQFNFERTWRAMPLKNISWSQPITGTTFDVDFGNV